MVPLSLGMIACHLGTAEGFAQFAHDLPSDQKISVFSAKEVQNKFEDQGVKSTSFSFKDLSEDDQNKLADSIAEDCASCSSVITGVGDLFYLKIQEALARKAPHVKRMAYYDNPESYVPGGYSEVAFRVMLAAHIVLFANTNLSDEPIYKEKERHVEIDFGSIKKVGLGYYPIERAEKIADLRKAALTDSTQKIVVYFGGNNSDYFEKAFPAFIDRLTEALEQSDLSDFHFILHQHPGAKKENRDANMLLDWVSQHGAKENAPKLTISNFSPEEAQVVAQIALYYQTSMAAQFVLAGIPTAQIGHKPYLDLLVRNDLINSITNCDQFVETLNRLIHEREKIDQKVIFKALGIQRDWLRRLLNEISYNSP